MVITFFRRREGYILSDNKRSEEILEELKVEPVEEKLGGGGEINKLTTTSNQNELRMPKVILNYRPNGRRRLGRPLKKLLDEAETGILRSKSWRMMLMIPK